MKIKKGLTRTAFIGRKYTVKVPRFDLRDAVGELKETAKLVWQNRGSRAQIKDVLGVCKKYTLRSGVLAGFRKNYIEGRDSKKLGNDVVPTRFSLFGLFNVIESAEPLNVAKYIFARVFPNEGPNCHTFGNKDNYGWHRGKTKLLDYGSFSAVKYLLADASEFRQKLAELAKLLKH